MDKQEFTQSAKDAFKNYCLWLSWYPQDFTGASEFGGYYLDTEKDLDDLIAMVKDFLGR